MLTAELLALDESVSCQQALDLRAFICIQSSGEQERLLNFYSNFNHCSSNRRLSKHGYAQHWWRERRGCVLPLQDAQIGGKGEFIAYVVHG